MNHTYHIETRGLSSDDRLKRHLPDWPTYQEARDYALEMIEKYPIVYVIRDDGVIVKVIKAFQGGR